MSMLPYEWISNARDRIAPFVTHTQITYDGVNDLFIKWESVQITGSFKVRGALNKILTLLPWEISPGIVTASAGNHGLGVAFAGEQVGANVTVFVPEDASPLKVTKIRSLGAVVRFVHGGYAEAERAGKQYTAATGSTWISPYNDGQVIAGQGTVCLEILKDIPESSKMTWVVPVGGGGLISGIACGLSVSEQKTEIVGVQSAASPYFHALYHHRNQLNVTERPTLADGLAGAIEENSLTIPVVRKYIHAIELVEEQELVDAMAYAWSCYGEPMEPSGAASLAAVLCGKVKSRPAVIVVSGGNIDPKHHLDLVTRANKAV